MRGSNRDSQRLKSILEMLLMPWEGEQEQESLSTEMKLYHVFNPDPYPIYRRKVLASTQVEGLWWMHETQWVRWTMKNQGAIVTRTGMELDRVMASRAICSKSFMYIRESPTQVDIEVQSFTKKWNPVTKKRGGGAREWMTCSLTHEAFKKLDTCLGPIEDGCKHEETYDFFQG